MIPDRTLQTEQHAEDIHRSKAAWHAVHAISTRDQHLGWIQLNCTFGVTTDSRNPCFFEMSTMSSDIQKVEVILRAETARPSRTGTSPNATQHNGHTI